MAVVFPPYAVWKCGKPFQAIFLSFPLSMLFWFPGAIHACMVVSQWNADRRHAEMLAVMGGGGGIEKAKSRSFRLS